MVLLSGEAGIGKSRLVQEVRERVGRDGATGMTFGGAPSAQQSALYPVLVHLQRLLHWHRDDAPEEKRAKLERMLATYRFPQPDTVPLLAALLSLPPPTHAPPLTLTPQQQRQRTLDALVATEGFAAPEVAAVYHRARELCLQVGETPQLSPVLGGLVRFYIHRGEYQTARELGEQLLSLAQRVQDPADLASAHITLGNALSFLREWDAVRAHLEQGIAFYNAQQHCSHDFLVATHEGVLASPGSPKPYGISAIRIRPCSGPRRRWPWPASCLTPSV